VRNSASATSLALLALSRAEIPREIESIEVEFAALVFESSDKFASSVFKCAPLMCSFSAVALRSSMTLTRRWLTSLRETSLVPSRDRACRSSVSSDSSLVVIDAVMASPDATADRSAERSRDVPAPSRRAAFASVAASSTSAASSAMASAFVLMRLSSFPATDAISALMVSCHASMSRLRKGSGGVWKRGRG
jgi:hypothetical protein